MAGYSVGIDTLLNAMILDVLNFLAWAKTEDGAKNRNRPKSIAREFYDQKEEPPCKGFESGKDFEEAKKQILKGVKKNGN